MNHPERYVGDRTPERVTGHRAIDAALDPCPLCYRGSGDGRLAQSLGLMACGGLFVAALWVGTALVG